MDPFEPPLDKARHLRYWQRCLRSMLPHHYTSMDSSRLSLCYFIIVAVDLLSTDTDKPILTASDRLRVRSWVLSCQHPLGGFAGSPTHIFSPEHQHSDRENANVAGTFFALLLLALVAEDESDANEGPKTGSAQAAFAGVDRVKILRWLRRLQRPDDGSFGEVVYYSPGMSEKNGGQDDQQESLVGGGRDMRYCYLAAAIRWMLRGDVPPDHPDYVEDIDVPALVNHIRRGQTYDGGFAESWRHESHAGYGYCAVAALALLDRPLQATSTASTEDSAIEHTALPYQSETIKQGIPSTSAFISWCFSRQFVYLSKEDQQDEDEDEDDPETANFSLANLSSDSTTADAKYIGFNGRCNKVADTCYVWWTLGSLAVIDLSTSSSSPLASTSSTTTTTPRVQPAATKAQRLFLLDKTQHLIGGFGKHPGSPPDVGHASLGLAALSTMGDPGLKRLDPVLCVSVDAVRKVELAREGLLKQKKQPQERDLGQKLVEMASKIGRAETVKVVAGRA
ncbi:terpenoid cyclases/protein prenyltransferase alpha-alpha toroid [Coniella lustricola]|uniref:Terpenoid cyclases/protein prenyltransferase alpha-alpha toroid n=1 Tax=Coniella lustricola TaxID=2025994 RepID=A0A2T3A767_9PEZI|nr:terpenoid cyclases/protein prenyltransferase alpha-alpha toroid [Coniella lustricola]